MYGLIGKMTAAPGRRDELIAILLEAVGNMPGCLSYIVAKDPTDADAIWITEAWDSQGSHEASLSLPSVRNAIAKGRPLIAGFGDRVVTTPVGGHGLALPEEPRSTAPFTWPRRNRKAVPTRCGTATMATAAFAPISPERSGGNKLPMPKPDTDATAPATAAVPPSAAHIHGLRSTSLHYGTGLLRRPPATA